MKPRADYFLEIADTEGLKAIQGEARKYKEDYEGKEDLQTANIVLGLYIQIAMDEGYRRVMAEMKKDALTGSKINIVPRKKGWFEYIDDQKEYMSVAKLVKRRINSKRMRKRIKKDWDEQGKEWDEDSFIFLMAVHTGWEHGYNKANTMEHMAKITCGGDQERADMILGIFNEIFTNEVINKLEKASEVDTTTENSN